MFLVGLFLADGLFLSLEGRGTCDEYSYCPRETVFDFSQTLPFFLEGQVIFLIDSFPLQKVVRKKNTSGIQKQTLVIALLADETVLVFFGTGSYLCYFCYVNWLIKTNCRSFFSSVEKHK